MPNILTCFTGGLLHARDVGVHLVGAGSVHGLLSDRLRHASARPEAPARIPETWRRHWPDPVFVFLNRSIETVDTSFKKARKKAGLEDFRFHDLRHTFASRLVQQGRPLYEVQRLLGYKSPEMTQRYAHLGPDFGEKAAKAWDAFWHKSGTITSRDVA